MRNSDMRFAKARCCDEAKPIATIWCDQQSEAQLRAEIAEREAKGFQDCAGGGRSVTSAERWTAVRGVEAPECFVASTRSNLWPVHPALRHYIQLLIPSQ